MSCEIISSVMSPAHIEELIRLSKTKKSHIGTNYKTLDIYGVTPKGVLIQINEKVFALQLAQWKHFPPAQEEILEAVDFICTDTEGKGAYITNYEIEYYPYLVEYFAVKGLKYKVLEKITKPDGTECVSLSVPEKTQRCMSESGVLSTTISGYKQNIQKVFDYLKKEAGVIYSLDKYSSLKKITINIDLAFLKFNKQKIENLHYKILGKVVLGEFHVSITRFMKYKNLKEEQCEQLAEAFSNANSHLNLKKEDVKRFIQLGDWANTLSVYCYKKLNNLDRCVI